MINDTFFQSINVLLSVLVSLLVKNKGKSVVSELALSICTHHYAKCNAKCTFFLDSTHCTHLYVNAAKVSESRYPGKCIFNNGAN